MTDKETSARNLCHVANKNTFLATIPLTIPAFSKATTLITRYVIILFFVFSICFLANSKISAIPTVDIVGPAGSGFFGGFFGGVVVLPNGNLVIVDSYFDQDGVTDIGAVYLYNGTTLSLISVLKGSRMGDYVGSSGIHVLPNSNFVVASPQWDNNTVTDAGAVTLCNGTTGCSGTVSPANSLVGGTTGDNIGFNAQQDILKLANGNYVVRSRYWDNGANADTGAITWCSGTTPTVGLVSITNSLTAGAESDEIGGDFWGSFITPLTNGNYVVASPFWDNGAITNVGAVTWGNGNGGTVGLISSANSLVGGRAGDRVGEDVTALTNGNYVVSSYLWDRVSPTIEDAGAVTWGNGLGGTTGLVSPANSLVGGSFLDQVGSGDFNGVTPLPNGNYVVASPSWGNVGAVTLGNGSVGTVGPVTPSNSLVGGSAGDRVGSGAVRVLSNGNLVFIPGVTVLTNGDYVVISPSWKNITNGTTGAGAVTRRGASNSLGDMVATNNSLIGNTTNAQVGSGGVTPLPNGSYVVLSPQWNSAFPSNAQGAATWCNAAGLPVAVGPVHVNNSLVGNNNGDLIDAKVYVLPNGNYVLASPTLDTPLSPQISDIGAVTWGSGTAGTNGLISAFNSLLGTTTGDKVGSDLTVLTNGNYVVCSPQWNNGMITDAGAATWSNGMGGTIGSVSSTNSLVGGSNDDRICNGGVTALTNGHYVVASIDWDNTFTSIVNAGAATWGNGTTGSFGLVTHTHSLFGSTENDNLTSVGTPPKGATEVRNIRALPNGNFSFMSHFWDNPSGPVVQAGAVTIGNGNFSTAGPLTTANSIFPTSGGFGEYLYDNTKNRIIIPRGIINRVTVQVINLPRTQFDFDGDGKTDLSIFRPSNSQWWYQRSSDNVVPAYTFGTSTDKIVPADYTGDGKTDIAFFRPSTSQWFILRSEDNTFYAAPFGVSTDIPTPGDYDGDGKADIAVFRPSAGIWFILKSSDSGVLTVPFGVNQDIPVVADYDGDGKADVAIYRPNGSSGGGEWWILRSTAGVFATPFGSVTDKPVQGDYTGDGKADISFFRPSTGEWFILRSENLTFFAAPFGTTGDIPSAGDYDGDGKFDFAVFRPSSATWFILKSTGGTQIQAFGTTGDIPVPSAFIP